MLLEAAVEDAKKLKDDGGDKVASDVPMCSVNGNTVELGEGIDLTDCLILDERQTSEWVPPPHKLKKLIGPRCSVAYEFCLMRYIYIYIYM
jgi:hypothetical protein